MNKLPRGENHCFAKLTAAGVQRMLRLRKEGWTLGQLAIEFDVTRSTVAGITMGRTWKHVPRGEA